MNESTVQQLMKLRNDNAGRQGREFLCGSETGGLFFMKLHRATRLHYDFRLEHAGVLKSWVILQGPCLDPNEPRPAEVVEDHEIEPGYLERVFPSDWYGAGPVLMWDYGIWLPCQDVDQALREGHLKFELRGSKLNGTWSLNRKTDRPNEKNWLLIKEADVEARSLSELDVLVEQPLSALTGRTLDEVAAEPHRVESAKPKSQRSTRSKKNGSIP